MRVDIATAAYIQGGPSSHCLGACFGIFFEGEVMGNSERAGASPELVQRWQIFWMTKTKALSK